jgi:hypothetical protein
MDAAERVEMVYEPVAVVAHSPTRYRPEPRSFRNSTARICASTLRPAIRRPPKSLSRRRRMSFGWRRRSTASPAFRWNCGRRSASYVHMAKSPNRCRSGQPVGGCIICVRRRGVVRDRGSRLKRDGDDRQG